MGDWKDGQWTGDEPAVADLFGDAADIECHCCGAKDVPLKVYRISGSGWNYARDNKEPPFSALCRLCSNTHASIAKQYHHPEASVLQAICFVGNEILKALRK